MFGSARSILPSDPIPPHLKWSSTEVQLGNFSPVQRTAYAIGNARKLVINLWLSKTTRPPTVARFCIHLEGGIPLPQHTPWRLSEGHPHNAFCGNPNRLIYQLNRWVSRYFRTGHPIQHFPNAMDALIPVMNQICIVCGHDIQTANSLLRSTACSKSCSLLLRRSELEIQIPELLYDPKSALVIIDALVSAVSCGHLDLLQPLPAQLTPNSVLRLGFHIQQLLTATMLMPAQVASPLVPSYQTWDRNTELFLSWAFTGYGGYLVSIASPDPTNPHLDNIFLVNAKPESEKAFADKLALTGGSSGIVYHGTTLDRLYPILFEGLRTQTRPGMVQTGNVLGSGIYTASRSTVAFGYARSFSQPVPFRKGARVPFQAVVLLVCELVQPDRHRRSDRDPLSGEPCYIYVTTDAADLIVRAVILTKPGAPFLEIDKGVVQRQIRLAGPL